MTGRSSAQLRFDEDLQRAVAQVKAKAGRVEYDRMVLGCSA